MSRKALLKSIEHWKRLEACKTIAEADEEGTGVPECALCAVYYDEDCEGCPVAEFTDEDCCGGTPYHAADNALDAGDIELFREKATEMRRFLEELL